MWSRSLTTHWDDDRHLYRNVGPLPQLVNGDRGLGRGERRFIRFTGNVGHHEHRGHARMFAVTGAVDPSHLDFWVFGQHVEQLAWRRTSLLHGFSGCSRSSQRTNSVGPPADAVLLARLLRLVEQASGVKIDRSCPPQL